MLDYRINTFLTVCQYMNFTRAAEALHITQPGVSQHIHRLEREYGVTLFGQTGKTLVLTPAGKILCRTMQVMANDEQRLRQKLAQATECQRLDIGVTMTIGEYAINDALAQFIHAHPAMDIHVYVANTHELKVMLQQGTISFALVEGYFADSDYDSLPLCTEDFIAVCCAGHQFHTPPHSLRDLTGETLILRESGSGTRRILENALATAGLTTDDFAARVEIETMHSIISLVQRDCGITFLYQMAAARELAAGHLRILPLDDFRVRHDFTFIWNKHSAFQDEIITTCQELRQGYVSPCSPRSSTRSLPSTPS